MKTAAIPSSLRKINRRLILRHMVQVPAAARGELAQVVGTSCVTAGKIVDDLLAENVLEDAQLRRESRPGRPGQSLRLNTRLRRFVLIQIGVAHTRVAFVPLGVSSDSAPRPWDVEMETPGSAAEWEAAVRRSLEKFLPKPRRGEGSSLTSLAAHGCWGVLLCVPGIVDETQSRVLFSPNVHWSEGVDFRRILHEMTRLPVEMVQEIRALALGQIAAAPMQRDFLLVDLGHGVGGASVVGGALYPGALPLVGELGHTPVVGNNRRCGCGSVGCLETLLSRRGLFQSTQESLGVDGGVNPAGKYVWSAVEQHIHKRGIEPWFARSLCAGAVIIAGAMNVLGVGRAVITGSFDTLPTYVRSIFAEEIRKAVLWAKFGDVTIEFAPRRRMRGLISVGIERFVVNAGR